MQKTITMKMSSGINHQLMLLFLAITLAVFASLLADAYDANPLQDFCVAVNNSDASVFVNGKICKDPKTVTSDDFYHSGLNIPGEIISQYGSKVTLVFIDQLAGLNTLGISMVRIDFAISGVNPPHSHPHASEILLCLEGTLYAGFISSNPSNPSDKNRLFAKVLNPGDIFVFPKGLIHFQYNIGNDTAVAIASLNSQNPGVVTLSKAVFGSDPPVDPEALVKGFQLDIEVIRQLQSLTWIGNG